MKVVKSLAGLVLLSAALPAMADDCSLTIEGNDAMQFNQQELSVPASCKEVTLTLNHTGSLAKNVMGHNWVLSETADMQEIANGAISAGADNDYLDTSDERIIAHTDLIGGGESSSVTFSTEGMTAGGDYSYFCSFPGHIGMMKGKFVITE
ncbi:MULTISPECIES: azurin [Oceanimonas]|uniref:Azurin n=1 Tax=Oceanimonas smirnovii TaxID=264574 RepID=A0ABW7P3E4_9GAMM|nr:MULTISPECIES: azurin [Oceanimonas]MDV2856629.1 azurin [Oceanimonas sp. CAM02]